MRCQPCHQPKWWSARLSGAIPQGPCPSGSVLCPRWLPVVQHPHEPRKWVSLPGSLWTSLNLHPVPSLIIEWGPSLRGCKLDSLTCDVASKSLSAGAFGKPPRLEVSGWSLPGRERSMRGGRLLCFPSFPLGTITLPTNSTSLLTHGTKFSKTGIFSQIAKAWAVIPFFF